VHLCSSFAGEGRDVSGAVSAMNAALIGCFRVLLCVQSGLGSCVCFVVRQPLLSANLRLIL
jgi:hypothetical protein